MKKYVILILLVIGSGYASIYAQEQLNVHKADKIQKRQERHQQKLNATTKKKERKMDKHALKAHSNQ